MEVTTLALGFDMYILCGGGYWSAIRSAFVCRSYLTKGGKAETGAFKPPTMEPGVGGPRTSLFCNIERIFVFIYDGVCT